MNRRGTIDDIEVLRGVAVIAVLIHHMKENLFPWLTTPLDPRGLDLQLWWGVDLFFVISGFVITRSALPALHQSTADKALFWRTTISFWTRRAWRLLPSAWLWLVLTLLLSIGFNQSGVFGSPATNLQAALAGMLQYANARFADSFMVYDYGASFVYWSLSLEQQFYLLFPLLIFISRRWLAVVMIAVVIIQLPLERNIWQVAFRSDALALGVLIALWQARREPTAQRALLSWPGRLLLGTRPAALIVLLTAMWLAAHVHLMGYHIQFTLVAWLSAGLVLIAAQDKDLILAPGRLKDLLCWVGSRSYGIYIIHIPAFFITREFWYRLTPASTTFGPEWGVPFFVTAMILLAVLSELNYGYIELPLRHTGRRLAAKQIPPAPVSGQPVTRTG